MNILSKEEARAQYFTSRDAILTKNAEQIAEVLFKNDIIPRMQRGIEFTNVAITGREAVAAVDADEITEVKKKVQEIFSNKNFTIETDESSDPRTFVISWRN